MTCGIDHEARRPRPKTLSAIVRSAIPRFLVARWNSEPIRGQKQPGTSLFFGDDELEVVTVNLDDVPDARALATLLSEAERRRANSFVLDQDRRRFIVGRVRLRQLLAERLGVAPQRVAFVYGAHGKPALAPEFAGSGLCFNLSHSKGLAVYAFAFGRDVGVDVEAIREIPDANEIAARVFSAGEREAYAALRPRDRALGFLNCWTRKEAFIKAIGDGLTYPLDRFDVSIAPGETARILRIDGRPADDCGWRMGSFCPASGFVAASVTGIARGSHRMVPRASRCG